MYNKQQRIGVLTSGGDSPGLNAVIRGIFSAAHKSNIEVIGFRDGFEGMLYDKDSIIVLDEKNTHSIVALGGTILGTTNRGHFTSKVAGGDRSLISEVIIDKARVTCDKLNLSALLIIGGDGSLNSALQLYQAGFPVIGIPKTIDNDIEATDVSFGFDSAVSAVSNALDCLHTTAASHKRVFIVQVMGRHTGWIALFGGIAGSANIILIPEIPFSIQNVIETILEREKNGFLSTMIVVSEGAYIFNKQQVRQQSTKGEWRLGGIGDLLCHEIELKTHKDTRVCILGHLQRGGSPTSWDRILALRFGIKAIQLVNEKKFGTMVAFHHDEITSVPIAYGVQNLKKIKPNNKILATARELGIKFGD